MSRVGKNPITIPKGVKVDLSQLKLCVSGSLGSLFLEISPSINIVQRDESIWVKTNNISKKSHALWGTLRAKIENMIIGVSKGFTKELEISGVGYRAHVDNNNLVLQIGFSHDVRINIPEGITVKTPKPTSIVIFGASKHIVGQFAANIRIWRKPEPYKGKGICYKNEYIQRKEGKKK